MTRESGYYWVRIDSPGCSPQVGEFSEGHDGQGEWRIQGEWWPASAVVVLSPRLEPPTARQLVCDCTDGPSESCPQHGRQPVFRTVLEQAVLDACAKALILRGQDAYDGIRYLSNDSNANIAAAVLALRGLK